MSNDIYSQLERDEGRRGSAYQDSEGYWTIGVGTCIDARKGCSLTVDEQNLLFHNRVNAAKDSLLSAFPWTATLDAARFGVLWNMVYEMGIHGLAGFKTMLACVQAGDWVNAAAALLNSLVATKQAPARYHRLAVQLEKGEWQ